MPFTGVPTHSRDPRRSSPTLIIEWPRLPSCGNVAARGPAAGDPFFTSDLSVNEFVLTTQTGFQPLGLVMGSCVYHIGFQPARWNTSQELPVLTQALYNAREPAMSRLQYEGRQVGASGVVGVQVSESCWVWGENGIEFFALGTAVSRTHADATPVTPQMVMPLVG